MHPILLTAIVGTLAGVVKLLLVSASTLSFESSGLSSAVASVQTNSHRR